MYKDVKLLDIFGNWQLVKSGSRIDAYKEKLWIGLERQARARL